MMIKTESEIRVALQAVLISILALEGCWGSALLVLIILLPWQPILAVAVYLTQPIVEWRIRKSRHQTENSPRPEVAWSDLLPLIATRLDEPGFAPPDFLLPTRSSVLPLDLEDMSVASATLALAPSKPPERSADAPAIRSAIRDHTQNSPALANMSLELNRVELHDDIAEVVVAFQSSTVTELIIRQQYHLRKSGNEWQVDSPGAENGAPTS